MIQDMIDQFTKEEAIAFAKSEKWKHLNHDQLAWLLLYQERLCIPFDVGHEAVEKVLGRPVWTHGFADIDALREEWQTGQKPTLKEIFEKIPGGKRIFVVRGEE
jgi:hypothetical protein